MTYTWERVTGSRKISKTPACVGGLFFTASASANNTVTLYDGESSSDEKIMAFVGSANTMTNVNFQPYLKTQRGLYLELGSNVSEVLIQYGWERE